MSGKSFAALGLIWVLFSPAAWSQSLLFQELYRSKTEPQFHASHKHATSAWNSPLGKHSTSEFPLTSQKLKCEFLKECSYKVQANYTLENFEKQASFGDQLEDPDFRGLLSWEGDHRYLMEFGVNSPSDQPFHSFDETTISFNAVWAPLGNLIRRKENYWLFVANYSSTRSFLPGIPLPGFVYVIPTESGWTYSLGAPFLTVSYVNFPKWNFRVTGGPYFYSTQLSYGPPFFNGGIESSWRQSSYFLYQRTNSDERIYLDEKELAAFLKAPVHRKVMAELKVAYVYDQKLKTGESYSRTTQTDLQLGQSAVIWLKIRASLDSPVNR